MSRTYRRQYSKKAKRVSPGCRSHGSCSYCRDGRNHKHLRRAGVTRHRRTQNPKHNVLE